MNPVHIVHILTVFQGDVQLRKTGDTFELCGLVYLGETNEKIQSLIHKCKYCKLCTLF